MAQQKTNWVVEEKVTATLLNTLGNNVNDRLEISELFGDGSDGNVDIISGTTTITRDMFYNNLTLSGGNLDTNGYRVFIKGTLTRSSTYKVSFNATGTGGTGGTGQPWGNSGSAFGGTAGTAGGARSSGTLTGGLAGVAGAVGGDGGVYNEGMGHFVHACRYNPNITLIVFDNQVFSLTTGQSTATSEIGFIEKTHPFGIKEMPLNPLVLALELGATFVSRVSALDLNQMSEVIEEAVKHEGFSLIEVLQPCLSYHDFSDFLKKNAYKIEPMGYEMALKEAKKNGIKTLAICNVIGSSMTRSADSVIYTRAGPEIGVASTKAYTAQLAVFYMLGLELGKSRGALSAASYRKAYSMLNRIPSFQEEILKTKNNMMRIAKKHHHFGSFLFLGRNVNFPTALEGALKLKEISYIPAEGYAAGEMKHGPIALIDEYRAVVCVAVDSPIYDKMISNIQEIKARSGKLIAIASTGNVSIKNHVQEIVYIPRCDEFFSPLLVVTGRPVARTKSPISNNFEIKENNDSPVSSCLI